MSFGRLGSLGRGFGHLGSPLGGVLNPGLTHWRSTIAAVKAGSRRGRVVFIGDSTSMGAGAGSGGTLNENGAYPNAWPQQLAAKLNTAGIPCVAQSFWASAAAAVAYDTYDTRVTRGPNWSNAQGCFGGTMFKFTAGAVNNLTFTPAAAFDTVVPWYMKISGDGTATINVDGGASLGTLNFSNATSVLSSTAFTVAKATHTINIVPANDALFFMLGIQTYDSTVPAIDFFQCAQAGATTATFIPNTNPWEALKALTTLAPDLTIIDLTINDSNAGTLLATYSSNIQSIITTAKLSGDVLLMVGPPSNTTPATDGTLDTYVAAVYALAASNGCSVVNMKSRWVSWAAIQATYPYFDSLHPGATGYVDIATAVAAVLAH